MCKVMKSTVSARESLLVCCCELCDDLCADELMVYSPYKVQLWHFPAFALSTFEHISKLILTGLFLLLFLWNLKPFNVKSVKNHDLELSVAEYFIE